MRSLLIVLALATTPFWLTGCSKSCEDMERELEELAMAADGPEDVGELAELSAEYAERCGP